MLRFLFILIAITVPAFLGALIGYQIYKKKTTTYMPLKNEFVHWKK